MSDDSRDRIADLRDGFDRDSQRYERAQAGATPVTASDSSGTVRVRLDENGAIVSVAVDETWRGEIGVDGLSDAVLEAYAQAAGDRARSWGTAIAETVDDPPVCVRPAPLTHATVAGEVMELVDQQSRAGDDDGSIQALLKMVEDLDRGFDEVFAEVDGRLTREFTGRSPSGHVRATVSGVGEVTSVAYDERWLGIAHPFNVGRETTEAIHNGLRQVASCDPRSLLDVTALGRLQRLVQDPAALADYLRLRG